MLYAAMIDNINERNGQMNSWTESLINGQTNRIGGSTICLVHQN